MPTPPDHPKVPKPKLGALLINLGTPDALDYWPMRRYLGAFLNDDDAAASFAARLGALRAAIGITALASDLQSGRRKLRDPEAHAAFGHAAVSEGAAADGDAPGVAGEESEEVRVRCGPNVGRDLPCGRSRRRSLLFD